MELEPVEIRSAKTSTPFFKKGEYIENEKLLLNLSDSKDFSELKGYLAKFYSIWLSVSLVRNFIIYGMY